MVIHGTEDETVPFDGDLTGTRFEGEEFVRVRTSTDIVTTTYSNCDDDVPLVFHEVVGGGHAWRSGRKRHPCECCCCCASISSPVACSSDM